MRILFNIGHPAHVHLFKNLIWELNRRGHQCKITTIAKDVSLQLLDAYGFEYVVVGEGKPTLFSKAMEMLLIDLRLYRIARLFRPDILIGGVGNVYVAHVGKMLRKPSIVFDDTEHAKFDHLLMDPFVSTICAPSCYLSDIGPKQIRYNGYHELAYLHPNRFTPNPEALSELGLTPDDRFIIVRFVSWQAGHDIGQHGVRDKIDLVKSLNQYGHVFITSEGVLPDELQSYRIRISPDKLHDLLFYAALYVGEGATTASECAMLGTHAIYVNTLSAGCITEQADKYGLISDFSRRICTDETVLAEAQRLLEKKDLTFEGKKKRDYIMEEKCDVTAFMIWFVENYPQSLKDMKVDPEIRKSFSQEHEDGP